MPYSTAASLKDAIATGTRYSRRRSKAVINGVLILGPFQGKVACVRIEKGKGVCGTAWKEDEVQLVPDVHAFPGHIACDGDSRSEILIPIHKADKGNVRSARGDKWSKMRYRKYISQI